VSAAPIPLIPCGHPKDKVGWAAQTGAEIKLDFLNPGDRMGMGVRYAQGASGFGGGSNLATLGLFGNSGLAGTLGSVAYGPMTDAVFVNGGSLQLTTSWTIQAGYEHYWTPALKSSFTAGYSHVEYNATARTLFATNVCPTFVAAGGGGQAGINGSTLPAHCDPDWGFFQGGVRTQWTIAPGFFIGLDTGYVRAFTAFRGATANVNGVNVSGTTGATTAVDPVIGGRPSGLYELKDNGTVYAIFRAQRNFNAGD
jgi:hypothetical protein